MLLTVNVRESIPHVQRYARSTGLTLPILPDPKGVIAKAWGIVVYPSTVLIDTTGTPRQIVTGAVHPVQRQLFHASTFNTASLNKRPRSS